MYPDYDYYKQIQILAWDLLIQSKANQLPLQITPVAKIHNLQSLLDYSNTRWHNTNILADAMLNKFGLNYSPIAIKQLSVRLLAPVCILKECHATCPKEIACMCDIPCSEAQTRLERLNLLIERDRFYTSDMEKRVCKQFAKFIQEYNASKGKTL